jgi:ribonucleoside-diphosphate reductase alpha chain
VITTRRNENEISEHVWDAKYRHRNGTAISELTIEDTWRRVAQSLAAVETNDQQKWAERFYHALEGFRFLPGGRILAGAGTSRRVTLFNCFVMGIIPDSLEGIFDALKEGALTMQQGGGVGYDFSTLRPRGTRAKASGAIASGPVSFMEIWDRMCATLLSTSARRGAMMATLRCDHPDIEEFIEAKHRGGKLQHFSLSVQVTDELIDAVKTDSAWSLVFPCDSLAEAPNERPELLMRRWTGASGPVPCRVFRRVPARDLWASILRANFDSAEPGVLFVDRVNRTNNLWYREYLTATNPCGEIPLPPYGACDLGSINLVAFVKDPFSQSAELDFDGIRATAQVATRLLDNVIDASNFPLEAQRSQAQGSRRIGLGITGLADALTMLGLHYADSKARRTAASVMEAICHTAYRTSTELAKEKGAFPFFEPAHYLKGEFVRSLPEDIRRRIKSLGIRNSHLIAIAPTGTISLLAYNVSSGIEPVFAFHHVRRVEEVMGQRSFELTDYAVRLWKELREGEPLPAYFVEARMLSPTDHLEMQAALQQYVDNAISKTINVSADCDFASFERIYRDAFAKGLKGCTTFRPNAVTGQVLAAAPTTDSTAPCCNLARQSA